MEKIKNIIISFVLALTLLNPTLVMAQTTATTGAPTYSGVEGSIRDYLCTPSEVADGRDLERCINKVYRFSIAFGAIALVFFIVFAGYTYISGGEAAKSKAKGILRNALVGVGLLLSSYVILNFINPNLVVFKPIQPPIFEAGDLPLCDEVGFEDDCTVRNPDGSTTTVGGAGGGKKVPCPNSKLVSAKSLGLPTKNADEQICEEFGKKLVGIKTILANQGIDWRITDTVGPGHDSLCHKSGNAYSGTCADIGLTDGTSKTITAKWDKVCSAVKSVGLYPHYEVDPAKYAAQAPSCPGFVKERLATGPHIHVMWKQ